MPPANSGQHLTPHRPWNCFGTSDTMISRKRADGTVELTDEDAKNMLRQMLARVIFLDPNDLNRGSAELIERDSTWNILRTG